MKNIIIDILKGVIIGIANIIPGVSGGTMAVSMGIYDKIVKIVGNAFHSIFKDFKNTVKFLLPIGIGAVLGIVLFSKLIKYCLEVFQILGCQAFPILCFNIWQNVQMSVSSLCFQSQFLSFLLDMVSQQRER